MIRRSAIHILVAILLAGCSSLEPGFLVMDSEEDCIQTFNDETQACLATVGNGERFVFDVYVAETWEISAARVQTECFTEGQCLRARANGNRQCRSIFAGSSGVDAFLGGVCEGLCEGAYLACVQSANNPVYPDWQRRPQEERCRLDFERCKENCEE